MAGVFGSMGDFDVSQPNQHSSLVLFILFRSIFFCISSMPGAMGYSFDSVTHA